MFSNQQLVQRISKDGKFEQFCSDKVDFVWEFIERKQTQSGNDEIFPMGMNG